MDLETTVRCQTQDLDISFEKCPISGELSPFMIVILGASGDLTSRKLMPALYNLFLSGVFQDNPFIILGAGRSKWSSGEFQEKMRWAVSQAEPADLSKWPQFARFLHYQPLEYDALPSFLELGQTLQDLDQRFNLEGNKLFYLALPPTLFPIVTSRLGQAGLSRKKENRPGWSRLIVEKPFGRDLKTALELDRVLRENFLEPQIFRIDHYLAKETVQDILMFRFANTIFEPIWNRNYIDYVGILAAEELGVGHRAGYYEQAGVLRDMFQSHMMQLLVLSAMESPSLFEADRVRDEKVKVFRSLRPLPLDFLEENLILGQYGPGTISGQRVPGYRQEPGVRPDSLLPTFAMMKIFIDNWRWKGVPFYLASGKALAQKKTQIVIQFKEVPHSMFREVLTGDILANRLILSIQPEEKITLTFQTKKPGPRISLRSVTMDFNYYQNVQGPGLDAYQKVLLDCIQGDHMLSWRQDGIELTWSFLTPIIEECEACSTRAEELHPYQAGSWGPEAAKKWLDLLIS